MEKRVCEAANNANTKEERRAKRIGASRRSESPASTTTNNRHASSGRRAPQSQMRAVRGSWWRPRADRIHKSIDRSINQSSVPATKQRHAHESTFWREEDPSLLRFFRCCFKTPLSRLSGPAARPPRPSASSSPRLSSPFSLEARPSQGPSGPQRSNKPLQSPLLCAFLDPSIQLHLFDPHALFDPVHHQITGRVGNPSITDAARRPRPSQTAAR